MAMVHLTPDLTPPTCPPWWAVADGHPYSAATEDGASLKRLHWQPVGLNDAEGWPVLVSIASVETNTSGVIALGTTIVTALTVSGGDVGSCGGDDATLTPGACHVWARGREVHYGGDRFVLRGREARGSSTRRVTMECDKYGELRPAWPLRPERAAPGAVG